MSEARVESHVGDGAVWTGEAALRWWVAYVAEDAEARRATASDRVQRERWALEWLYDLAPKTLSPLTKAEVAAGYAESREDRARDAVHQLVERLIRGRWPGASALPADADLRKFVAHKLRRLDVDARRAWRARTPEYVARRDQPQDVTEDQPWGPLVSGKPLPSLEEIAAEEKRPGQAFAEDVDATLALLEAEVIQPCADAQGRADARESVATGLRELFGLRHGPLTMKSLVDDALREAGVDVANTQERRKAHQRIGRRQRRARHALQAWLEVWHAASPPEAVGRRTAFLMHAPGIFRLVAAAEPWAPAGTKEESDA